jgi:2-polyprenyl-6-methoxyphenol hydroxylase-like FAD-dependent oxidoreductase
VPIDVLWFKLTAPGPDPQRSLGFLDYGKALVALDRGSYWQCGYIIAKGQFEEIKNAGIEKFRMSIASLAPFLAPRVHEITDWEQVKLLSVTIDGLTCWYKKGLVCIGDAAHAMSPMGGVGINLAIQDAIAAGNILIPAFKKGTPEQKDLAAIQTRREFPTKVTQRVQVFLQDHFFNPYLHTHKHVHMPFPFRLFQKFPFLRGIPARFIGVGVRPEHISKDR